MFQSTHSRGVRQIAPGITHEPTPVSIHALTRSATIYMILSTRLLEFQSTHSRGVRQTFHELLQVYLTFQSTHSRGVRQRSSLYRSGTHVSIHALTRSATSNRGNPVLKSTSFNPRTHEECDCRGGFQFLTVEFQSTHSRGVRRIT